MHFALGIIQSKESRVSNRPLFQVRKKMLDDSTQTKSSGNVANYISHTVHMRISISS